MDLDYLKNLGKGYFPEFLGIEIIKIKGKHLIAEMMVKKELFAPNGYLHAGSIVNFSLVHISVPAP